MLKMMTFFQGLPGQQSVLGTLNFPGSPQKLPSVSESESEASMSEASSEDLVPPPEAVVAPDQEQQEAAKKKKPTVLSNMFSIFTKGKKKRGQPSLVEPPLVPESKPGLDGPPIPTVTSSIAPSWRRSFRMSVLGAFCPQSRFGCWRPRSCPVRLLM
uniref:Tumor necrosis factor alpha-induced protein 2 n=1 Tax=Ictidomys tridecemlineatus TaxID=43179 RepID=I3MX93_ICTTR